MTVARSLHRRTVATAPPRDPASPAYAAEPRIAASSLWRRALVALRRIVPQLLAFGGVGIFAFIVDVGGYNLLRATVMPDQVIGAKIVSVTVATAAAYLGHRYLTFRRSRAAAPTREIVLFVIANAGGMAIAAGCLYISHYVLGFTSTFADNVAGNGVGLVLATAFRYLAYRLVVFRTPQEVSE